MSKRNYFWAILPDCIAVPDTYTRDTGLPGDPRGGYNIGFAATKSELAWLARLDRAQGGKPKIVRATMDRGELVLEFAGGAQ